MLLCFNCRALLGYHYIHGKKSGTLAYQAAKRFYSLMIIGSINLANKVFQCVLMRIFCGYLSNFWRKFTKFLLKNLIVLVFNLPIFVHIFSVPFQASIDREGKCYKFIKNKWNSHKDLIICQIVTMLSMKCSYSELVALCEKCPNTEAFLVRIFPHSDWIRRDTTDQKELRIWTLLT